MSKRLLAILGLMAALGLGTPALMADHGNKDKHHNKHDDWDDEHAWERRDGYEYRVYSVSDNRPPGWGHAKKTGWGNCGLPSIRNVPSTTIRMNVGRFLFVARSLKFTAA
jgi:hypothetical protein